MTPERERLRVAYVAWRDEQFHGARFMHYTDSKMFTAFRAGYEQAQREDVAIIVEGISLTKRGPA